MNNRRNKKNNPSSKREKAGFYIAFSLCLAAVGMSVWSAYTGVTNYFKENGIKGEFVGMVFRQKVSDADENIDEKIEILKSKNFKAKEISVILSSLYNINKNEVYKRVLEG